MARTFDVNGDGEQPPAGTGFDAANGAIGSTDGSGGGDEFGATTFGGTGDSGSGDFDPTIHISRDKRNADGTYRRKRQRKGTRGERTSSIRSKADLSASIDRLTTGILIAHVTLSEMTKTPELKLTEPESNMLAASLAVMMDEFGLNAVIDPKLQAVFGLISAATMIYGPRLYNIRTRLKTEGKKPGSVHHLRPVDNNSQIVTQEPFAQ